uniref:Uncharacterized protein n=1 Tax=Wuchereria bancrofti TaxID=6293 RepID=A0A1I8EMS7_WUCBA
EHHDDHFVTISVDYRPLQHAILIDQIKRLKESAFEKSSTSAKQSFNCHFAFNTQNFNHPTINNRCKQIQANPSNAAEILLRERLIFSVEDLSGRRALTQEEVVQSNMAFGCVPRLDEAECQRSLCYNLYYRTMDGTCNNLLRPLRGAAFRPYNRLLLPEYDNKLSEPVVSRFILSSRKTVQHGEYNALLMQWGQYLIHEMAKTTLVPSANFKSNRCIRVSRSSAICGSGKQKPRQQLNENTNFIDGSPIYGSSVGDLHKFREGKTGFLKTVFFNGLRLLPFDIRKCRNAASCSAIFVAGDSRVNLFMGLSSYHIILTREHNRYVSISKIPNFEKKFLIFNQKKKLYYNINLLQKKKKTKSKIIYSNHFKVIKRNVLILLTTINVNNS